MNDLVFQALAEAARAETPVALGIISGVKGSSPQKVGAKAVFYLDGRIRGTLGGGCLEAEIQRRAIACLRTGQAASFELVLDHDFGWDDGLICGGKVEGLILPHAQRMPENWWRTLADRRQVLRWGVRRNFEIVRRLDEPAEMLGRHAASGGLRTASNSRSGESEGWRYEETLHPRCALWIAGAGHIAQAVAPLALQLDFRVTVFDDRPALADRRYFASDIELRAEVWDKLLATPLPDVSAFGLIVTRGHRHDALVLSRWIHLPFVFLGMIGSTRKARTIFEHLTAEGIARPDQLARVACPVGVPILSRTVPEIAVSILAQYIQKRAEHAQAAERATGFVAAGSPSVEG